jgi:hypothetical protein
LKPTVTPVVRAPTYKKTLSNLVILENPRPLDSTFETPQTRPTIGGHLSIHLRLALKIKCRVYQRATFRLTFWPFLRGTLSERSPHFVGGVHTTALELD